MNLPLYRFDQLFEKMPNGAYRERPNPVPRLGIEHRHDFFTNPKTKRICVLYPAQRLERWNWGAARRELEDFVFDGMVKTGQVLARPLTGGHWMHGTKAGNRRVDFDAQWFGQGLGWSRDDEVRADVMMQAVDHILDGGQQSSSGGTNGGITETPTG